MAQETYESGEKKDRYSSYAGYDKYKDEMTDYSNSPKTIRPESYIETISGALTALLKIPEGAAGFLILFFMGQTLFAAGWNIAKAFGNLQLTLNNLIPDLSEVSTEFQDMFNNLTKNTAAAAALPAAAMTAIIAAIAVAALMMILEMVALIVLRFAKAGAGVVRVIRAVYFILSLADIALIAFFGYEAFVSVRKLMKQPGVRQEDVQVFIISAVVILVVALIIALLQMCYNLDIVKAMGTVSYEISSRLPDPGFRKTHLSGISFLFAVPYIVAIVLMFVNDNSRDLILSGNRQAIIMLAMSVIPALKYMAVSACYGNLRKAHFA